LIEIGRRGMSEEGREKAKNLILSILQEYMISLSVREILMQIKARRLKGYGNTHWGTLRIAGFLRLLRGDGLVECVGKKHSRRWRIVNVN